MRVPEIHRLSQLGTCKVLKQSGIRALPPLIQLSKFALVFAAFCLLAACDGGSSDTADNANTSGSSEGLWLGTTDTNRMLAGLMLDNGSYWIVYSIEGNSAVLGGVVQGNGSDYNGTFSSFNGKDVNLEGGGTAEVTLDASYINKNTLSATLAAPLLTPAFASLSSDYGEDYELTPSLATIAMDYVGTAFTAAGNENANITISSTGDLTGAINNASGHCNFAGTAAPRSHGNVYDVSFTFASASCYTGTNTVYGVAYFDATTNGLMIAVLNATRSDGILFGVNESVGSGGASVVWDIVTNQSP